jgi:hypothetical protein
MTHRKGKIGTKQKNVYYLIRHVSKAKDFYLFIEILQLKIIIIEDLFDLIKKYSNRKRNVFPTSSSSSSKIVTILYIAMVTLKFFYKPLLKILI